jgi:macrolide transport system ATP-binding/permease protein
MRRLRGLVMRLAALFTKKRREHELADEMESHLQLHIDDNVRAGMTYEQARRAAILRLGGVECTKEACRDRSTLPLIETVVQDARFALRQLRKSPGFACTAIAIFALGLGGSVSLFAFVDAALIRPLPYVNPNRLVYVTEKNATMADSNLSYFDYLDWKQQNKVFQSLDVFRATGYLLETASGSKPIPGVEVSAGFFRALGVKPVLGRDFSPGEDLRGATRTLILSYGTWQQFFGGNSKILGRTVRLSGVPYLVIGVLPRSFQFAPKGNAAAWTTLDLTDSCETRRSCHSLGGIARLKDSVSLKAASANLQSIAEQLERKYPESNRGQLASVVPLSDFIVGTIRPILLALLGGGVLLLLISCVNVASLLLARSEARRREMAVRSSLGASTTRLFVQFGTETCVLVGTATAVGLLLSAWATRALINLIPADTMQYMPFLKGLSLNAHIFAFAAVAAGLTCLVFAVIPGLYLKLSDTSKALAEASRGSAGRAWRRLGSNLVVAELAIAMVLLVGAGLLTKSLDRLLRVNLGFKPDHLATLSVSAPQARYGKDEQMVVLGREVEDRVRRLAGVQHVGLTSVLPVTFNGNTDWIRFVGRPYNGQHNEVNERDVNVDYFKTIQARLIRGRYFSEQDDAAHPGVVIINESLAKKYFPGEDPLGKRFGDTKLSPKSIREIVGVVDDIREGALDAEIFPAEYEPFKQSPDYSFSVVVRTGQDEHAMLPAISAAIGQIDPEIGTLDQISMTDRIYESTAAYLHRSAAWLVAGFAGLALLLGVIGLYGVVAYSVSQRTREIGIRMALGAERSNVRKLVLGEAGRLTIRGLIIGLFCSVGAAMLIRKLLFQVSSWDVPTLVVVAVMLAAAAILASYIPAQRAASVNPVDALRME